MVTVYTFAMVPPFAQGLVRDLRVRWALEEAGLPYDVQLVGDGADATPPAEYRRIQPFGQVPAIDDGDQTLFESGAIVFRIAGEDARLLPRDEHARAETVQWMFCALNTMEPSIQNLATIDLGFAGERWAQERRPAVVDMVTRRLSELARQIDGKDYLIGDAFTAADILMVTVLRMLRHTDLVSREPVLAAYQARCEARPAFRKALADQMAVFEREAQAA